MAIEGIAAGLLRESITIEAATETRNNIGGVVQSWSPVATVRAQARAMRTEEREIHEAMKVSGRRSEVFVIRLPIPNVAISTKHRILWDGITWDIQDLQYSHDDRNRVATIFCLERTDPN